MRALAQILVDKDKGVEAFESYMKSAFPWIETTKKRDRQEQIKRLQEEIKRGPMQIQPLWQKPVKSRLKTKADAPTSTQPTPNMDRLFKKMGKVIT